MTPAVAELDPLAVRLLYSPHEPTERQHAFHLLGDLGILEALYGGAAGGGKSDALLADALRYVDTPGYAALLLRRTYADLALPGALMDRAHLWLSATDAVWNGTLFRWTFPAGATLTFGYLQTAMDVYRYQGAEFQFIGFDEVTQFRKEDYRYLFTRLRRPELNDDTPPLERARIRDLGRIPLRMRAASNPGGRGHDWVKSRFIKREVDPDDEKDTPARALRRVFIPAKLADNPHVDRVAYTESLDHVDPHLRAQMLEGDWDAREPGDWVYRSDAVAAAEALGAELDALLDAGTMIPPAGGHLHIGIDWGEHTHVLLGWPLERGGLYIAGELELDGVEANAAALLVESELVGLIVGLGRRRHPQARVTQLAPHGTPPPALPPVGAPLGLVDGHRYDAAGISSMRTYMAAIRRKQPRARSVKVPFGAPAPITGKAPGGRSYKAETIGHLRRLLERTLAGDDVAGYVDRELRRPDWTDERLELEVKRINRAGRLALSRRAPILSRQMRALEWLDRDAGKVRKGDDHAPDALIALDAPYAIRHR